MKKLFLHHPLFRLLSPIFSGTMVYLLILLINNNIDQLQEQFLGQELYVCIGLAYIIQEFARGSLVFFHKLPKPASFVSKLLLQLITTILACIALVSAGMYFYFNYFLGYTPNLRELLIFNSIFVVISLIYLTLYLSHQFLHKVNTARLEKEMIAKQTVEANFRRYKQGINPQLLFETLESLLVLMKTHPETAEDLTDHFSGVYRYLLSKKSRELVPLKEELPVIDQLLALFAQLPYRKMRFTHDVTTTNWVVPGSLVRLVERIIRSTIPSEQRVFELELLETQDFLRFKYAPEERLTAQLQKEELQDIILNYSYYSEKGVEIEERSGLKFIDIPKLTIHESSHP